MSAVETTLQEATTLAVTLKEPVAVPFGAGGAAAKDWAEMPAAARAAVSKAVFSCMGFPVDGFVAPFPMGSARRGTCNARANVLSRVVCDAVHSSAKRAWRLP